MTQPRNKKESMGESIRHGGLSRRGQSPKGVITHQIRPGFTRELPWLLHAGKQGNGLLDK